MPIGTYQKRSFVVSELAPNEGYKLGSGLVVPRPIGWIGTIDAEGRPNLAPYSFFNMVSGDPPTFVFSPGRGARKDTLRNVREVGEFTINTVTDEVVEAMNATSATVEAGIDEFALAGLTAVPSDRVRPPLVGECKANFECIVTDIIDIGHPDRGNTLVIGEAVMIHVADHILDGTRVDQAELRAVGRHVGSLYSHSHELFAIERPA